MAVCAPWSSQLSGERTAEFLQAILDGKELPGDVLAAPLPVLTLLIVVSADIESGLCEFEGSVAYTTVCAAAVLSANSILERSRALS